MKQKINEIRRMQQLAGLIKENQQIYVNDDNVKFRSIKQDEFNNLETFGLIGIFKDEEHPEDDFIANFMYDKLEDFSTEEEAKRVFDELFTNPDKFSELVYDDLYYHYKRISNKDRFSLKELIPATIYL